MACAPLKGAELPGSGPLGASVFATRCAICHGATGAGNPGSFPSLHAQVEAFAKSPQGLDYLVMVVSKGLVGELNVAGIKFNGVMPPQSGLKPADVASVVNFLASGLGRNPAAGSVLTESDVVAIRTRLSAQTPQMTRAARPAFTDP